LFLIEHVLTIWFTINTIDIVISTVNQTRLSPDPDRRNSVDNIINEACILNFEGTAGFDENKKCSSLGEIEDYHVSIQ
jgi:hypothetical protein